MADQRMVRIAEIEVDPGQIEAYNTLLAEVGAASVRDEPGVLMLHSVSLQDAPHHIRVFEVYASRAAYEAHIQTPHFLKYKTGTSDMVTALRLIEVDPILLAAK
jgi:quinol monooxygenase YgiN